MVNEVLQVAWALTYCSRAARHSLTELNGLLDCKFCLISILKATLAGVNFATVEAIASE